MTLVPERLTPARTRCRPAAPAGTEPICPGSDPALTLLSPSLPTVGRMDEQGRRSARTRAAVAFGLAGVLLVVNVALALAWREERHDRFDRARIEFDQRTGGERDQGDQMVPGPPARPGDGQGGRDRRWGQGDQGGRSQMGPGGRSEGDGSGSEDQDGSTDGPTTTQPSDRSTDQDQEGAA